jgi:hypothetical protein
MIFDMQEDNGGYMEGINSIPIGGVPSPPTGSPSAGSPGVGGPVKNVIYIKGTNRGVSQTIQGDPDGG